MYLRWAVAWAAALCALLVAARARAWQEAHQTGDSAQGRVEADGSALVRHLVVGHVVRGPLKSIDLVNVDALAALEPNVEIAAEDGRELAGRLVRRDDKTVRVSVDEPRALMRGTF